MKEIMFKKYRNTENDGYMIVGRGRNIEKVTKSIERKHEREIKLYSAEMSRPFPMFERAKFCPNSIYGLMVEDGFYTIVSADVVALYLMQGWYVEK